MIFTEPASTNASLCASAQHDRRQDERNYTVFRVARLIMPDVDQLGIVRNISEHGMMLELHPETALGDQITLDLGEGHRLLGEVRWRHAAAVGLSFSEPIDVARVLGKTAPGQGNVDGKVPRLPRIKTDSPAEITFATHHAQVRLVNISIGGACVETHADIARQEQIALTIPSLPTKVGTVRWKRGNLAGIVFDRPMSIQVLMDWLVSHQKARQATSPALAGAVAGLSDARLANLYLTSVDQLAMVVVTDRRGRIVRANKRFQQCTGYSCQELVGANFYDLHAAPRTGYLIEGMPDGETWRGELELVGSTGARFRLNAMIVAAADRPDLVTCFMFEAGGQSSGAEEAARSIAGRSAARRAGDDVHSVDRDLAVSALDVASERRDIGRMPDHHGPVLSKRELQVLQKVADGLSNEEIGNNIGLSRRTIEIYRAKLLAKLGAQNTAAAVHIACKKGII